MPTSCVVPNCNTGKKSETIKRSVFHVPRDEELLKKWTAAMPDGVKLRATHVVCEKHFEDKYIARHWIKYGSDGHIIAKAPYKRPVLSKLAVPTIFDDDNEETNCAQSAGSSFIDRVELASGIVSPRTISPEIVNLDDVDIKMEVDDGDSTDYVNLATVRHVPSTEYSLGATNIANNGSPGATVEVPPRIKVEDGGTTSRIDNEPFHFVSVDSGNTLIHTEVDDGDPIDSVHLPDLPPLIWHVQAMKQVHATNIANTGSSVANTKVPPHMKFEDDSAASKIDIEPFQLESIDLENTAIKTEVTDDDSVESIDLPAVRHVPSTKESVGATNVANNGSHVAKIEVPLRPKVEDDGAASTIDSKPFCFESVDLGDEVIRTDVTDSDPIDSVDVTVIGHFSSLEEPVGASNIAKNGSLVADDKVSMPMIAEDGGASSTIDSQPFRFESVNLGDGAMITEFTDNNPIDSVDEIRHFPANGSPVAAGEVSAPITVEDDDAASIIASESFSVSSSVTINERIEDVSTVTYLEYLAAVPSPWSVCEHRTLKGKVVLFSFAVMRKNKDESVPVTQRCVVLNADRTLEYFVYGHRVKILGAQLNSVLSSATSLLRTLEAFERMGICNGLGTEQFTVPIENAYQDCLHQWRNRDCTLISRRRICECCRRHRNRLLQSTKITDGRPMLKRIPNENHESAKPYNPLDNRKIVSLLKNSTYERHQKSAARRRANIFMSKLQVQREKIARIDNATLEKKCSDLNVPDAQKLALKRIILAAGGQDSEDYRHSDEWMMLCMIMNIRLKPWYEWLFENNVLPLPCSRTMRNYFSLINPKCRFDEQFADFLEKRLATKIPSPR